MNITEKPLLYENEYSLGTLSLQIETFSDYKSYPERYQNSVLQNEIEKKCPYTIVIYTDASKLNNQVGAAWHCPATNSQGGIKLHPATSTYTAEMIGILRAIEYALTSNFDKFLILSDCNSVIQKLSNWCLSTIPTHLHIEILRKYASILDMNKSLKLAWVKGHAGTKGNQKADTLARHATTHGELSDIKLCPSDVKCFIEKDTTNSLEILQDQTNGKGIFYKKTFRRYYKKTMV